VLVAESRSIADADVLVAPVLERRKLLNENVAGAAVFGDEHALVRAEDAGRLVRADDAAGQGLLLEELQVLSLVEVVRHRSLRRRPHDVDPVLDVVRGDDRQLGPVFGGDDLRAGPASASLPRVDEDVLLGPCRNRKEERRRADVARGAAERIDHRRAHRYVRLQLKRRGNSGLERADVLCIGRDGTFWTARIEEVFVTGPFDVRIAVGDEEDDALSRWDGARVLNERGVPWIRPEHCLREIERISGEVEGEVDGPGRRVHDERGVTPLRVGVRREARHLKEELAAVRAPVCGRRRARLLAERGATRLICPARLDDLAGAGLEDRTPVERTAEPATRSVGRRVGDEATIPFSERRAIVAACTGREDHETDDSESCKRAPHGSTTSWGFGNTPLGFLLPSCPFTLLPQQKILPLVRSAQVELGIVLTCAAGAGRPTT
jgi:hypothetical protein